MSIIGRKNEMNYLSSCLESGRPEFLVLYGRRRVGNTYLIKEYFGSRFSFYATGVSNLKTKDQLRLFNEALIQHGSGVKSVPKDWFEAFSRLKMVLEDPKAVRDAASGRRVVFLDELPWMDTARSNFKSALDYFWNSWASSQSDLFLIVCGSATSWIIENIFSDRGGFYNRITRQIHLMPFTLKECEELFAANGIVMSRRKIIESYMVFGGIPYYLNCFDRRLSLAQNIDELLFKEGGQLHYEYERLFRSLFRNSEKHIAIIEAIAEKKSGITRVELAKIDRIGDGEPLTKALGELEQCGFIRKYKNYTKKKQGFFFQVIDPFILFALSYLKDQDSYSWMAYINSPGYYAWCGNAFEIVCLNHIYQMKAALGVSGVVSAEYAWRSRVSEPGVQIDLLIDRKDDVINLCEMKYTVGEFSIDASYERNLMNKLMVFQQETGTDKSLHLTLVSANGLKANAHSGIVQNVITGDDMFI